MPDKENIPYSVIETAEVIRMVTLLLKPLTDVQRTEIFHAYCVQCGTPDIPCACGDDA